MCLTVGAVLCGAGLYGLLRGRAGIPRLIAVQLLLASAAIIVVATTSLAGGDASSGQVVAVGAVAAGLAAAVTSFPRIRSGTDA